ncbi:MucR family transcriptional regulator [Azorhizobium oxalatiphilum]|nr:MucR family transcriptional regulator [Azorhizobium oxalatiphilum]
MPGEALLDLTSDIVSAYVSNNTVAAADLPGLINTVSSTLAGLHRAEPLQSTTIERTPAVPVKKSVNPDFIICLEDGKKFKSLKRHLATSFDMTPDEYRQKWNLPYDYPMVAPNYSKQRSQLALDLGLGKKEVAVVEKPAPRTRKRKTT